MPSNTHESGAVTFVNQKGERSMKRVKVERYVAGKRPAYAKDEDDEEYYTTDEDMSDNEEKEQESEEEEEFKPTTSGIDYASRPSHSRDLDNKDNLNVGSKSPEIPGDDDDDDDPRFSRLRQLESKIGASQLLDAQTSSLSSRGLGKIEERNVVIEEDEEEDEEIRQRHALARARTLEEPLGPQVISGDLTDQQLEARLQAGNHGDAHSSRREETEDILKDLKLTGIRPIQKKPIEEEVKDEEKLKDLIEQAKQEAIFTAQLHKKIEEDNKKELEKEALSKGDIGARDMEVVKTDDEDEELAYEEWKLREIKRLLRDKSERALEARAKA